MATKGSVKIHSEHITGVFPSFTVLYGGHRMMMCSMPMSGMSIKKRRKRSIYFWKSVSFLSSYKFCCAHCGK